MSAGALTIALHDHRTDLEIDGSGSWTLPIGPRSLVDGELEGADRLVPEQLTNALGIVTDHLDDVIRESPMVSAAPDLVATGRHAMALARVELGTAEVPHGYRLARADADDVFRTLVAEPAAERIHNPGLLVDDLHTVVGTSCVILAIMRRLERTSIAIDVESTAT
jgi:exopolyphosphatase/guanosine-5'-triphosphate,3'-diphosphate pyrophosphatase